MHRLSSCNIHFFIWGKPQPHYERGSITETKCNEHLQCIFHTASPPAANRQTPYIDHPKRYMNTTWTLRELQITIHLTTPQGVIFFHNPGRPAPICRGCTTCPFFFRIFRACPLFAHLWDRALPNIVWKHKLRT
jgi:hypothetical protein